MYIGPGHEQSRLYDRTSQEEPGRARRSGEEEEPRETGGARKSQEEPGGG